MASDLTGGVSESVAKGRARLASKIASLEIKDTGNAKLDAMGDVFNNALGPFHNAPPPEQGALGVVNQAIGAVMGLQNIGMELMNTGFAMATAGIAAAMPAFPAAFLTVPHIGMPHTHVHPPSLIPPAPPVPLPSIGTLLLAGSVGVLICGMPAGRCGDLGLAITCGSLSPAFDVFLGSSNTFIAGNRAARMTDMTRHCNPASAALAVSRGAALFSAAVAGIGAASSAVGGGPVMGSVLQIAADLAAAAMSALLGKDPGVPPAMGALMMGAPTVLIGGFPCPNLPNPLDALMHGLKCLGKMFLASKALGKLLKKVGLCNSPGEPINPFTGEVYNDFADYHATDTGFVWERHYRSGWNQEDGPLGYGYRHFYQRTLTFYRTRAVYETHDNEAVALGRADDGSYAVTDGFTLSSKGGKHFELLTDRDETLTFELQPTSPLTARLARYKTDKADVFLFYDSAGRLYALSESPSGDTIDTLISYDAAGHIEQVVRGVRGGTRLTISKYAYQDGCLAEFRDVLGGTVHNRYDDARRVVQATDRRGFSFHWHYDPKSGRCIKSHGDDGTLGVEAVYQGTQSTFTEGDGGRWLFKHYPDGTPSHVVDPQGGIKQYLRDDTRRIIKQVEPDGTEIQWLYDPRGKHVARLGPFRNVLPPEDDDPGTDSLAHRGPTTQAGWLLGHEAARPTKRLSRLPAMVAAALAPALAAQALGRAQLDAAGRLVQCTYTTGAVEHFHYDPEGNLTAHQDTRGNWWQRQIVSWDSVGAERTPLGAVTQYGYTHRQRRAFIVDPHGWRTDYQRDKRQRIIAVHENGAQHIKYERDPAGLVRKELDGNDLLLASYKTNELGLHASRSLASGEQHEYAYDDFGNLTKASSSHHEVTQRYFRCKLTQDLRDGGGIEHYYGADERVERSVFLDRFVTEYSSAIEGHIQIITPDGATHRLWQSVDGAFVRENGNGTCEASVFDTKDRVLGRSCWKSSAASNTVSWFTTHRYSPDGLLEETVDSEQGVSRFDYDPDRRLIAQQGPGPTQYDYRYDNAGNLSYTPAHGNLERRPDSLVSHSHVERFECDDRKRIAKRIKYDGVETTYSYDSIDQLIGVSWSDRSEAWSAAYDGIGRRLWREYGGQRTHFYWDGDRLAAEVAPNGALTLYVYANVDALVPFLWLDYESVDAAPESAVPHYLFTAPTGYPLRIENATGDLEWKAGAPEPYGELRGAAGRVAPPRLRFAGHFYDEHLDLFYNRFRDYDPKLGRYLQRDPWGHGGGPNLYGYSGNPLVEVDLRGLVIHRKGPNGELEKNGVGASRKLNAGEEETAHLDNGLRKVTTGDKDGGFTVRHFDANGRELTLHKFNEHGQLTHAEVLVGPKEPNYKKGTTSDRGTPEGMQSNDQRGHVGPEVHMPDKRAANTPENILAEHQKSNQGPKRQFENGVPDAVDKHSPSQVKTVHDFEYPDENAKRPSSSSHGVTADDKRDKTFDSGPIPNDATAKSR